MKYELSFVLATLGLLGACGNQDSINEVQYGLTSAAAIARIASLSMDAVAGTSSACASVKTACTGYPCDAAITINLGAGCPLPLGGEAAGTVDVTGRFTSEKSATLAQTFANARISTLGKELAVARVTQVSAQRSGATLTVSYAAANAVAGAGATALAVGGSATWNISVDTNSTPDPADDRMTVQASSASAGGLGSARVISIDGAVLDPSCRQNPTAGTASITEVSGLLPKIIKVQFHPSCDGKAEVNGNSSDFVLLP